MGRVADFFREQNIPLAQQQRAKMVSLDRQVEELEAKVKVLETENLHLKAEVNPLKQRVQRLEQQLEEKSASRVVEHALDPSEVELIKFIGNERSATSTDLRERLGMHSVHVEHFLGRLLRSGYIEQSHVPMVGALYTLSDKGNAYLIEQNLVPLPNRAKEQPSNPRGYCCDHCNSTRLKRTGSKPHKHFGEMGVKDAFFTCLDCGKESVFMEDPNK